MRQSIFLQSFRFRTLLSLLMLCFVVMACSETPKKVEKEAPKEMVVQEVDLSEKSTENQVQPKVVPSKVVPPEPLPEPWPEPDPIFPNPHIDPPIDGGPCPTSGEENPEPYDPFEVDVQPEYPGGMQALMSYIDAHLIYPPDAMENGIEGRVFVRFTVLKTGETRDFKILRGLSPSLDREVIRTLKGMEKWKPGILKDQPVDVYVTIPVKLTLD